MKEKFRGTLIHLATYAVIGGAVMAGMRAVEWIVPKPETRVIICTYDDMGKLVCKAAADLMRAKLLKRGVGV